jgi:hypothetical protein
MFQGLVIGNGDQRFNRISIPPIAFIFYKYKGLKNAQKKRNTTKLHCQSRLEKPIIWTLLI